MIRQFIIFLSLFAYLNSHAQLSMPALFSDNMVLQQEREAPIWGTAKANEEVKAVFNGKTYSAKADAKGKWMIKLPAAKYGGPFTLQVKAASGSLQFKNILIGEVWVCSGQSNMEMPLEGWTNGNGTFRYPINHSEHEIADAQYPKIRLLQLEPSPAATPQTDIKLIGKTWRECSPQSVRTFSATAYFFAREVFRKTGIPIGLIESSVGGTTAELWTSRPVLKTMEDYKDQVEKMEQNPDPNNSYGIGSLYNGMIAPLIPYGIRGVLWYQGEFSSGKAYQYKELFPKMIKDWRDRWQEGNFPFYFVQLPVIGDKRDTVNVKSGWVELREAQFETLSLPNTGMAVTIDFTDNDLHPANKQDVGFRLALIALNKTYGKKIEYSGPLYKSSQIQGNTVKISFSNPEVGLMSRSGDPLSGFFIAGKDKIFHRAEAKIEGSNIVVSSPEVTAPESVRYAWDDNPNCNLFSKSLVPASPFRTDDWEMSTRYNK